MCWRHVWLTGLTTPTCSGNCSAGNGVCVRGVKPKCRGLGCCMRLGVGCVIASGDAPGTRQATCAWKGRRHRLHNHVLRDRSHWLARRRVRCVRLAHLATCPRLPRQRAPVFAQQGTFARQGRRRRLQRQTCVPQASTAYPAQGRAHHVLRGSSATHLG